MPLDALPATRLDAPNRMCAQPVADATPSGSRPLPWFVIASHSQAERRAAQHLAQQGYQTYLPLCAIKRRDRVVRSMFHTIQVPLFSGYLFTSFDPHENWRPILYTPGVFSLIRNPDGKPIPVPQRALEAVRASEDARRTLTPREPLWRPGAACRLAGGGAFDGHDAVVTAVHHDRAVVALLMLGHLREVQVSLDCLVARES